jgi:ABC-type Mn2+/Zn2+ transport system ATPase subunit
LPEPPLELSRESARLDIEEISVGYHNQVVLENLSFQVPHGGQVAIVGPNGAGKSTLFKALVGLLPLSSGRIFIHGLPLGHHLDCVAYVPQREEVEWHFPVTVSDVVMMGRYGHLGWLKQPSSTDRDIVFHSLEQMGIDSLAKKAINNLSGGQQQRVFLARAIAQQPHILLMDEPFTAVDIATQEATLNLLDQLQKDKVTVMVSTHDLNMASQRFRNVLLLNHTLIAYGPPSQVFSPQSIRKAFGNHVLTLDGAVLVDECCSHEDEHEEEPL